MKEWLRHLARLVTATGFLAAATIVAAQTCKLELKKVDSSTRPASWEDTVGRATLAQGIFFQIGGPEARMMRPGDEDKPEFSKVISKEPAKYEAKHPFRGVAKLGTGYYGFVFDAAPPKEPEKTAEGSDEKAADKPAAAPPPYSRLYFDVNHNGDLTDDPVVEGELVRASRGAQYTSFPRIDLAIDVDGKKADYAFTMRVNSRSSGALSYATASLSAAAYRVGEMTIAGEKRRIVLVDFNSNGLFNDEIRVGKSGDVPTALAAFSRPQGDRLYMIDPEAPATQGNPFALGGSDSQCNIARLVALGGSFFDLTVQPSGEELTLDPTSSPLGYVVNSNKDYSLVVYGEKGIFTIVGDDTGKARLPEGEWKLMSYTIDLTSKAEPPKQDAALADAAGAKPSDDAPVAEPARERNVRTVVSARFPQDQNPVKVVKDETVELSFGPPFQPVVSARVPKKGSGQASLGLSLVGVGGDVCSGLSVNGRRPDKPKFTITTADGEEVASGAFEYG